MLWCIAQCGPLHASACSPPLGTVTVGHSDAVWPRGALKIPLQKSKLETAALRGSRQQHLEVFLLLRNPKE